MVKSIMAGGKKRFIWIILILSGEKIIEVISNSFMPQDMVQEKKQTNKNRQFKIEYNHNLKSGSPPKKYNYISK